MPTKPDVWECNNCGYTEYKEQEVICWGCGEGEMIFKGQLWEKPKPKPKAKPSRLWGKIRGIFN